MRFQHPQADPSKTLSQNVVAILRLPSTSQDVVLCACAKIHADWASIGYLNLKVKVTSQGRSQDCSTCIFLHMG